MASAARNHAARAALRAVAWTALAVAALAGSLAHHLTLPETRALVRHLIEGPASGALRGDIEIGRVEELGLGRAVFLDVVIRDPEGRVVIHAPRVTAWPDVWRYLDDGTIRVAGGRIEDAEVVLYVEGPDGLEVSLVQAFEPAQRGAEGGAPVHVLLDGLRIERARLHGDAPRFPGLRVEDLDIVGRIAIDEHAVFTVHEGRGRMLGPYPGSTEIERIVLSFSTDRRVGLDAYAEAARGPSHLRARAQVTWPETAADAPPLVRITAAAEPLCLATLAEMGFAGVERLRGCAEGWAVLEGPPSELSLRADLTTAAGRVAWTGRLPDDGRYAFEARAASLALDALIDEAPALSVSGRAAITLGPDRSLPAHFELDADPLTVAGYEVPAFSATGWVEDERVVIDSARAADLDGTLEAGGTIGFDGEVTARVALELGDVGAAPNVARLVPGAHGGARGTIDLVTGRGAATIDVRWDLVLAPFRYGPLRAARLDTRGRASGPLERLAVSASARASGTTVSALRFGTVEATIEGGAPSYRAGLHARGGADVRELDAALQIEPVRGGVDLTLSEHALDLGFGRMRASAPPGRPETDTSAFVAVRGDQIELSGIALAAGSLRASARGHYDPRGDGTDLHLEFAGFDLAQLHERLPEQFRAIGGTARASLDLAGDLAAPDARLEGAIEDATLDGRRRFRVGFTLSHSDGALFAQVDGDLGDTGHMRLEGPVQIPWAALFDPARVRAEAVSDGLDVALDRVNLAFLLPFLGERVRALGITGKVTMAVRVVGPLSAPEVPWGVVILDNFAMAGTSAVRAKLEGSLVAGLLSVERVWIADTRGELLQGGLVARLPLDDPPETGAAWVAAVAAEPWQAHLELNERRTDGWPRPLAKYLPPGVLVRGAWDVASDGHAVVAHLDAAARWDEPASRDACATELRPAFELVADTDEHGVTHGHVAFLVDGAVVATATTTSRTPLAAWLAEGTLPPVPTTLADVELRGLALERLPWTCSVASGEVAGHARASLFSAQPDLEGELYLAGLRVRAGETLPPSAPYRAQIRVLAPGAGLGGLETCVVLGREDGGRTPLARCPRAAALEIRPDSTFAEDGEMIAVASVPMRFADGALWPEIAWDGPFFALLDARMAQLEPLLVAVPGIAQANATAEGTVWARGPWEALAYEGALRVADGEARVLSMGQYLHDVGGPLRFEEDRIVIPASEPWRAWDGERAVSLFGEAHMRGLVPSHVEATARPEGFPFRREGSVLAELSGEVHIAADIAREGVDGVVDTGELTIALPQTSVGAVQDLALRPEVLVIGEDAPDLGRDRHIRFPYRLRVDARRPFTVSRNDFEVRVSSMLDVTYDEPDLMVGGVANIERGTFEVLGKRFAVARGALAFDGTASLDPTVDLVATYEIPGRPGATISLLASGTLSNLIVDFQSTESSDTGEILALLVSGRASRATDVNTALRAGQQAASFLTGLAGGLLTLSLREQFGSLVPTISLEDGGLGTVAARVGWDVDWIIPDFLREVVLGAYFEGTFGSRSTTGGVGGGVGVGVTMELQFPLNFTASGSYLVPSNGSVDLLWDAF
jgi:hypothetical protein